MAALKLQTTSSNETATNQTRALADSLLKGPRRDRWREKKPPIFFLHLMLNMMWQTTLLSVR